MLNRLLTSNFICISGKISSSLLQNPAQDPMPQDTADQALQQGPSTNKIQHLAIESVSEKECSQSLMTTDLLPTEPPLTKSKTVCSFSWRSFKVNNQVEKIQNVFSTASNSDELRCGSREENRTNLLLDSISDDHHSDVSQVQ